MGKCKECGKGALPGQEYCMTCNPNRPSQSNPGRRDYGGQSYRGGANENIPADCVFSKSFYSDDGYLERRVSIESSAKMASILQKTRPPMTQTSIRQLFNMIKAIDMRLKADKGLPVGFIRENYNKFLIQTTYQVKRGVIPGLFGQFVEAHQDIAVKSVKEFKGFVEYLTSIVARMKQK